MFEQEINVDDESTENVHTFLVSDFLSIKNRLFSEVSTIIITNKSFRWVSW